MPDCKVDRGQLGRKRADVYAEYLAQQLFVGGRRLPGGLRKHPLARVGPYQESAAAARRVENPLFTAADTEGVDEVHNVRRRVELAEPPALAGAYELLVHLSDHVEVQAGEVKLFDALDEPRPVPGRRWRQEWDFVAEVVLVRYEDRLVVAGVPYGFAEPGVQYFAELVGRLDTLQREWGHLPELAPHHLIEDQPGHKYVARQPRCALQVLPALVTLYRRLPPLGQHPQAQPSIELGISARQPGESVLGVGDGVFQCALKPADETLVDG